jgi:hypothetical protein
LLLERPTLEAFVARRTSLGSCRYRWESLEDESRKALLGRARGWLKEMPPGDFEEESEVIVTAARRPRLA